MSFQCLVPTFNPPRLKLRSIKEKIEVEARLNERVPVRNELFPRAIASASRIVAVEQSIPHNSHNANANGAKLDPPSSVISLFGGAIQYDKPSSAESSFRNGDPQKAESRQGSANEVNESFGDMTRNKSRKQSGVVVNAFTRLVNSANSSLSAILQDDDDDNDDSPSSDTPAISIPRVSLQSILLAEPVPKKKATTAASSRRLEEDDTSSSRKKSKKNTDRAAAPPPTDVPSRAVARDTRSRAPVPAVTVFQARDFFNVQHICRNGGSSEKALDIFLETVRTAPIAVVGVLWRDLSSNHIEVSNKFCTPSTRCQYWYCACDKHIRAEHASVQNLLGIVVLFPTLASSASEVASACFFLPLVTCVEPNAQTSSSSLSLVSNDSNKSSLPLKCATTLEQRISAFRTLMSTTTIRKELFHTQLASLTLSALTESATPPSVCDLFDPRVAHFLLRPDLDDAIANLELRELVAVHSLSTTYLKDKADMELGTLAQAIFNIRQELQTVHVLSVHLQGLLETKGLSSVCRDLEMPLSFQLGDLERRGVNISTSKLQHMQQRLHRHLQTTTETIYKLSGLSQHECNSLNIASPEQISNLLFNRLQLKLHAKSSTGASTTSGKFVSTSEETLRKISHQHPIVEWILTFRSLSKLQGTYIAGLEPFISSLSSSSAEVGTIHAWWNQVTVRTGRLSCSRPNLQNIPSNFTLSQLQPDSERDFRIREFFIPRRCYVLVAADYSQIEMRVLAHVTRDRELCRLFQQREGDIYKLLASKIFNKPQLDQVSEEERTRAKVICLGCIYGMGPVAAAARLNLDVATVSRITSSFFRHFQGVKRWIQTVKEQARQKLEVRTLSGRIRSLPDILSEDNALRAAAERQAVNTVIQGSASDLIKSAMLLVARAVRLWETQHQHQQHDHDSSNCNASSSSSLSNVPSTSMLMQIHDEIVLEVPVVYGLEYRDAVIQVVRRVMEQELSMRWRLQVPLLTKVTVGEDWGHMQPWTSVLPPVEKPAAAGDDDVVVHDGAVGAESVDDAAAELMEVEDEVHDDADGGVAEDVHEEVHEEAHEEEAGEDSMHAHIGMYDVEDNEDEHEAERLLASYMRSNDPEPEVTIRTQVVHRDEVQVAEEATASIATISSSMISTSQQRSQTVIASGSRLQLNSSANLFKSKQTLPAAASFFELDEDVGFED